MDKPVQWPNHMNHIKAKSVKYGGETLAEHTWDVLEKLAELYQLRPSLPALANAPRLWHCLFWACFLHDFGKAASGFQARLAGGPRWNQRHEVLSLAFLDWISPAFNEKEQIWVLAAIVSHHRDASSIARDYAQSQPDPLSELLAEIDAPTVVHLWRWLHECNQTWCETLGFTEQEVFPIALPAQTEAISQVIDEGVSRTRSWLQRYSWYISDLNESRESSPQIGIILRGLTTSADHMGSAHLIRMPDPIKEDWRRLAMRIRKLSTLETAENDAYQHQRESAAATSSSAILIAPTGSGKTEAALYWALGDGSKPIPRIFYALPYQASMNAMFDRLQDSVTGFGNESVGIQHGRALQIMYARLIEGEQWSATAATQAQWQKNINTLHARPIKVFSPYQMLKALFQIRGFEAMLTDYAEGVFIFDEIHAYEPARLALILTMIKLLREHYHARFFVMSATFPELIRDKLAQALGTYIPIQANQDVFDTFTRHQLHLLNGDLLENIDTIIADFQAGKQVLVCVNTVRRAQEVQAQLEKYGLITDMPERKGNIVLVHSRFVVRDRTVLEKKVLERCALHKVDRKAFVLIATQVVEVSLNIDLDTIYSDPAPLEALLQRFGRVNRACKKGICPVHVFREPQDGQGVYGRSRDKNKAGHIVRITLTELEKHNGQIIPESEINKWLDAIYSDSQLEQEWNTEYKRVAMVSESMIRSLIPFDSSDTKEEEFENLFDGVDVLPKTYETEYLTYITQHEYIEASRLFVSISKQRYGQFLREGKIRLIEDPEGRVKGKRWMIDLPYKSHAGLSFEIPLTDLDWS